MATANGEPAVGEENYNIPLPGTDNEPRFLNAEVRGGRGLGGARDIAGP